MKKDLKYKVGIIGCGRIASILEDDVLRQKPCTHAGAFDAHPDTEIVAACDINKERLLAFGKRWCVKSLYEDYTEMLTRERLDIVSIAAWTEYHRDMVIMAAESGVRGVYCEKPIAVNLKHAKEMVDMCKKMKVKLVIGHERRWDPYYRKARELIHSGAIGEIRTIIGNALSDSPPELPVDKYGGGPMFHDGTHLTDLLRFFAGDAEWVSGYDDRMEDRYIEKTAIGLIRFKNGVHAVVEGGGVRKYFNFELDIQGSEGRILIGNGIKELYMTRPSNRFTGFKELKRVEFPNPDKGINPFLGGIEDLIGCMNNGHESVSSGEDGKAALEIIMAIYKSARLGGERVFLPIG
ncbi:MAG: Gfo/Idh/MocA family oxidoreductase [Nitrospinae bacterium]|nr:Gfo/Idh/MocA family oxidoreductase [Nitrospinota bacterium]